MTTRNLLQRQLEIIQRSQSITSDYETGKSTAEARLKRDRETAESTRSNSTQTTAAAWKRDKATTEQNWSGTKTPVDRSIRSIREAIRSTQDVLNRTGWQGTLSQDTLRGESQNTLAIPTSSSFVEQMAVYQSVSEQASRQIKTLLENYRPRNWPLIAGVCGFIIAGLLFIILTVTLTGFFYNTTRDIVLTITCLLTFASTSILIYTLLYTLRTQNMLAKLRRPYINLLQAVSPAEDFYNKQLPGLEGTFKYQIDKGQNRYRVSIEQIDQAYQRQLEECQTRYNEARRKLEQTMQQQVKELKSQCETFIQETGLLGATWTEPMWKQWQPFTPTSSSIRLGSVTLRTPQGNLPPLPLFVSCPGGENILFEPYVACIDSYLIISAQKVK